MVSPPKMRGMLVYRHLKGRLLETEWPTEGEAHRRMDRWVLPVTGREEGSFVLEREETPYQTREWWDRQVADETVMLRPYGRSHRRQTLATTVDPTHRGPRPRSGWEEHLILMRMRIRGVTIGGVKATREEVAINWGIATRSQTVGERSPTQLAINREIAIRSQTAGERSPTQKPSNQGIITRL